MKDAPLTDPTCSSPLLPNGIRHPESKDVALYTRVSTEEQAKEGFSLAAQLARLRSFAVAQGWNVIGEYVDDGQTGRDTKRPAYQKMMKERSTWDTIAVLKMDRIHRNSRNFMTMMDQLNIEEKGFASVMESLDTATAMGRFVMDIIQRIAQLESEQIGERVFMAQQQKIKTTKCQMGAVPDGLLIKDDNYAVDPKRIRHIEYVFDKVIENRSLSQIAELLNARKIPKPRATSPWTSDGVRSIARNLSYAGVLTYGGLMRVGNHSATIELEKVRKVNEILSERGIIESRLYSGDSYSNARKTALAAAIEGREILVEYSR